MAVSDIPHKQTANTGHVWPVQSHRALQRGKKADFCCFRGFSEPFGALWDPLGRLLAFWLGPKGGKWLCQTSPINRQPILAMCGQFRPTGRFREVKKLIFAVLGAFWSLLEPSGTPFGLLVGSKRWQMVVSDIPHKQTVNSGLVRPVQIHRGCQKGKKADFCCFRHLLEPPGAHFGLLIGSKGSYSIMSYISHQVRHVPTATNRFDAKKCTISSQNRFLVQFWPFTVKIKCTILCRNVPLILNIELKYVIKWTGKMQEICGNSWEF